MHSRLPDPRPRTAPIRRLAAGAAAVPEARPAPGLLLPWLGMAAAAVLLPWVSYAALGLGNPWSALGKDLMAALWPVLAGAILAAALGRWGGWLPAVPEGDLLSLAGRAGRIGDAIAAATGRAEAALRAWPVAGLALLALVLVLFGATVAATR